MHTTLPLLKPNHLQKGQTVGLIAPASPANEDEMIRAAIDTLASLGFEVKPAQHLFERWGYLAGADADRAADLNAMFADDTVDGIVTITGGYGSSRLLPYLDYDMIRSNPKVLMGYSDITALLNGIHNKTGLVTFHGPIAKQTFTPYTLAEFKKVVMQPVDETLIAQAPAFEAGEGRVDVENRLTRIVPGKARGRLVGGNLSLMAHLTGSEYCPDFTGKIVVLEEVGEQTYVIDRYLTQLWLSGNLAKAAGIAFGKFTRCTTQASWAKQLTVEEILTSRCRELGIPTLRGLMIGHVDDQTTFPLGCEAELDVDAGTLRLLEKAVQ